MLKPLPRRASLARLKVPERLKALARTSWFMWSFKRGPLLRAIYFGSILALLPLMGIQLFLSVLVCALVRANLPVTAAIQFITNPFTAIPVYGFTYWVGYVVLNFVGGGDKPYDPGAAMALIGSEGWGAVNDVLLALIVGGVLVGVAVGVVIDLTFRLIAWEAKRFQSRFRALESQAIALRVEGDPQNRG